MTLITRCGSCRQIHHRIGGLRCRDCLSRAQRVTQPGWAVVHYRDHDDPGKVVSLDDQAVVLRFPGNAEDTYVYCRFGDQWAREPAGPGSRRSYVEITFGEGGA